jgi:GNAT superfamily N-acetyltransferase
MPWSLTEITPRNFRIFHDAGRRIYDNDPNWIAPLDLEVENIFNPAKNLLFSHGEAIRWVLYDDHGNLCGRIAAFIDLKKAERSEVAAGGAGFFECINDREAAALLFDAARDWLKERGARVMDGSINFGENFSYWGVLVEGFMPQGYGMPYNKPYYRNLFEDYGFRDYFQQFTYHFAVQQPWPERMVKFSEYLSTRPGYSFRHFEKGNPGKYIRDLVEVVNQTWSDYMEDFEPFTEKDIEAIFETAKPILIEEFVWFAYKDDRPVGVVVAFPDVNQVLARFNGRLNIWKALKFMWLKNGRTITRNRLLLAGVTPEFQNSGVIAALFLKFALATRKKSWYTEIELSWVGDYNPRMRKVYEQIGAVPMKKHITYRYVIDSSVEFSRFTNEGGNSTLRRDALKKEQEKNQDV